MLATSEHFRWHVDVAGMVLDGSNRNTCGDAAHEGHKRASRHSVIGSRNLWLGTAKIAFNDIRPESGLLLAQCRAVRVRQLDDFESPGPVRHAPDEATLLQRHNQAMHTRLGLQIERVLHLLERGGNTLFLEA